MEAPPVIAPTPARPRYSWLLVATLAMGAGAAVLYFCNPTEYGFYPRCMLYVTTGFYCPGCGATRALYQLAHGRLFAALRCNVLLVAVLPFAVVFAWRWARCRASGKPMPQISLSGRAVTVLVVVMMIFTVLRNIRCAPFIYLAPP